MSPPRTLLALAAALLLGTGHPLLLPQPAAAGCGCDHPAPAWAPVMPPFASPGGKIRIDAGSRPLTVGRYYYVQFHPSNGQGSTQGAALVRAQATDHLFVTVPQDLAPGPVKLQVTGWGYDQQYDHALFTALPAAAPIPAGDAALVSRRYPAAVSADGTLLIPIDLRAVRDATQFAFLVTDWPIAFGPDDVVFYNRDGVDLTLFTLDVEDASERQWGSYHGWRVERDAGLWGTVYDNKVEHSEAPLSHSDLLTYWRHEFHTYAAAHGANASHSVDANGYHPDGTRHVDHDHLVIAIHGMERDRGAPLDPTKFEPLDWGKRMDLLAVGHVSEVPVEPGAMLDHAQQAEGSTSLVTWSPSGASDDDDD
jgi:hypothetical protein